MYKYYACNKKMAAKSSNHVTYVQCWKILTNQAVVVTALHTIRHAYLRDTDTS